MLKINTVYQGNCLEVMKEIYNNSIDLILTDLPYGVTARNKWDLIIPIDDLFKIYKKILKVNGCIVMTTIEPFTTQIISKNYDIFKYKWIWIKSQGTGFLNAKKQPLRNYEEIIVFYSNQCIYNPIMRKGKMIKKCTKTIDTTNYNEMLKNRPEPYLSNLYYPKLTLKIKSPKIKNGHPTQKPVELFEYLIKTYTNENMLVLDNCFGSGTTGVSCINTKRNFIGIELNKEYAELSAKRCNCDLIVYDSENKNQEEIKIKDIEVLPKEQIQFKINLCPICNGEMKKVNNNYYCLKSGCNGKKINNKV